MLQYDIAERGYATVVGEFEEKFASYLTPTHASDPPPGVPAEALTYFPFIFPPGLLPLLAASELAPVGGKPRMGNRSGLRISAIRFGVRIYARALERKDPAKPYMDKREVAKRDTREVWSNWLEAFQGDSTLGAYEIRLDVNFGDQDPLGGYLAQPNTQGNVIFWVHASTVTIEL